MPKFLFVGERRSAKAIRMGVTWLDRRLCSKNLHEALEEIGIDPKQCKFSNIFEDEKDFDDVNLLALRSIRDLADDYQVVALGRKVESVLLRHHIAHIAVIHPAARGTIRKRENYIAHLRERLSDVA